MEPYKLVISRDAGESGGTMTSTCKIRRVFGPMTYVVYDKSVKKSYLCTIDTGQTGTSSVIVQDKYDREISTFENITVTLEDKAKPSAV